MYESCNPPLVEQSYPAHPSPLAVEGAAALFSRYLIRDFGKPIAPFTVWWAAGPWVKVRDYKTVGAAKAALKRRKRPFGIVYEIAVKADSEAT